MTPMLRRLRQPQLTVRGWQFLMLLSMGLLVLAGAIGLADDATDVPPPLRLGAELVLALTAAWDSEPGES